MIAASLKQECRVGLGFGGICFRDHMIAASLKRHHEAAGAPAPRFPRSYDRGLIEARKRGGTPFRNGRFPRSYDRGLIEAPGNRGWSARQSAGFRDHMIAASLKPGAADVGYAYALFPRSYDRGLIEASHSSY